MYLRRCFTPKKCCDCDSYCGCFSGYGQNETEGLKWEKEAMGDKERDFMREHCMGT